MTNSQETLTERKFSRFPDEHSGHREVLSDVNVGDLYSSFLVYFGGYLVSSCRLAAFARSAPSKGNEWKPRVSGAGHGHPRRLAL